MTDDHGFAFIYCVKNENECAESCKYVDSLKIPNGYTVSKKFLQGNFSVVRGNNFAMRNSTAKYKIYLHKNIYIINRNFLLDIIELFKKYPVLGMLGVLGAKKLPANGNWWETSERYGKIYIGSELLSFHNEVTKDYESVLVIAGMIMITQYDLPWREDIFKDPYLYDSAQCLEFFNAGYKLGIPRQTEPWCVYNNPNDNLLNFYKDREVFINEYRDLINNEPP